MLYPTQPKAIVWAALGSYFSFNLISKKKKQQCSLVLLHPTKSNKVGSIRVVLKTCSLIICIFSHSIIFPKRETAMLSSTQPKAIKWAALTVPTLSLSSPPQLKSQHRGIPLISIICITITCIHTEYHRRQHRGHTTIPPFLYLTVETLLNYFYASEKPHINLFPSVVLHYNAYELVPG